MLGLSPRQGAWPDKLLLFIFLFSLFSFYIRRAWGSRSGASWFPRRVTQDLYFLNLPFNKQGNGGPQSMSKILRYRFIAFPVHLDTYGFLNEDEKSVLRCLIRLGDRGWFYGDKKLAKNLGIGVYHLRRAKLRLHVLGLLKIEKRGSQNYTYFFQDDIQSWRLTENINAKLQVDHEKMGLGRIEFKTEPFKSDEHFNNYFTQMFPKFANGRKGRSQSDDAEIIQEAEEANFIQAPVRKFKVLTEKLETAHPTKILSDYFNYRPQINDLKYGDSKPTDPDEIRYLETLDAMADKIIREPDEKTKLILDEVHFRVKQGDSNFEIGVMLDKIYRAQIKNSGGSHEVQK